MRLIDNQGKGGQLIIWIYQDKKEKLTFKRKCTNCHSRQSDQVVIRFRVKRTKLLSGQKGQVPVDVKEPSVYEAIKKNEPLPYNKK